MIAFAATVFGIGNGHVPPIMSLEIFSAATILEVDEFAQKSCSKRCGDDRDSDSLPSSKFALGTLSIFYFELLILNFACHEQ